MVSVGTVKAGRGDLAIKDLRETEQIRYCGMDGTAWESNEMNCVGLVMDKQGDRDSEACSLEVSWI